MNNVMPDVFGVMPDVFDRDFDVLEKLDEMSPDFMMRLRQVSGGNPLTLRLIALAYNAGQRDACAVFLTKTEEAINTSGYTVSDAGLKRRSRG